MLWGTSSLALYIPWAGTAGPYLGISLWLWLGVLDAIQGVGLGMILLQVYLRFIRTDGVYLTINNRLFLAYTFVLHWPSHRSLVPFASWSRERPLRTL